MEDLTLERLVAQTHEKNVPAHGQETLVNTQEELLEEQYYAATRISETGLFSISDRSSNVAEE